MDDSAKRSVRYEQKRCQGTFVEVYPVPLHHCIALPLRYVIATSVLYTRGVRAESKYYSIVWIQESASVPSNSGIFILAGFTAGVVLLLSNAGKWSLFLAWQFLLFNISSGSCSSCSSAWTLAVFVAGATTPGAIWIFCGYIPKVRMTIGSFGGSIQIQLLAVPIMQSLVGILFQRCLLLSD